MMVPLLFTRQMQDSIELLIKTRNDCGILKDNKYIFANVGTMTNVRGSDAIRFCRAKAECVHPERVTATCLRKECATLAKVVGLTEQEVEELAAFLGHDLSTHKKHYRLPESTIQTASVGDYLMKISSDLQAEEIPEAEAEGAEGSEDEGDESENNLDSPDELLEDEGRRGKKTKLSSGVKVMKRPKKRNSNMNWVKWTTPQKESVMKHLSEDIEAGRIPGKTKCSIVTKETPCKGRDWVQVKNFCRNEIKKRFKLAAQ